MRTNAVIQAAELTGLAAQHPVLEDYADLRNGEFATLKREVEAALPADELAAALERGKTLDLDTVIKSLLAEPTA